MKTLPIPHSPLYEATLEEVAFQLFAGAVCHTRQFSGCEPPADEEILDGYRSLGPDQKLMYRELAKVAGEVFREYAHAREHCGRRQ